MSNADIDIKTGEHVAPITHLNDEQFTGLLLGAPSAAVRQHLQACARCTAEATRISDALGGFTAETLGWAEQRIAWRTTQPHAAQHLRRTPRAWLTRPVAWGGSAMAAALAIGLVLGSGAGPAMDGRIFAHAGDSAATSTTAPDQSPDLSPERIKADNALMSAIDGELDAPPSAAVQVKMMGFEGGQRGSGASRKVSN